jgi:hypothetical protein
VRAVIAAAALSKLVNDDVKADPLGVGLLRRGREHRARDAVAPELGGTEPPRAPHLERMSAEARAKRRVHDQQTADAGRRLHAEMRGDLAAPGAARDEGLIEPERVEELKHGVGVGVGLHLAARRIALTEARAVDADRAPPIAKQGHQVGVQAVIAEQRRPQHDRRAGAFIREREGAETGGDSAEVGRCCHGWPSVADARR